jgi:hypothetical protein
MFSNIFMYYINIYRKIINVCVDMQTKHDTKQNKTQHYKTNTQEKLKSKIWGFHGGGYEECRLLECCAVWLL